MSQFSKFFLLDKLLILPQTETTPSKMHIATDILLAKITFSKYKNKYFNWKKLVNLCLYQQWTYLMYIPHPVLPIKKMYTLYLPQYKYNIQR